MSAVDMVREDGLDVIPGVWTDGQLAVMRTAAEGPRVERIFVNAAIKRAMCRVAAGGSPGCARCGPITWHNYHFHVRLVCPRGAQKLSRPGADAAGRRLRRLAGLVVFGRGAASKKEIDQGLAADDDVGAPQRMPAGAAGEVVRAAEQS